MVYALRIKCERPGISRPFCVCSIFNLRNQFQLLRQAVDAFFDEKRVEISAFYLIKGQLFKYMVVLSLRAFKAPAAVEQLRVRFQQIV